MRRSRLFVPLIGLLCACSSVSTGHPPAVEEERKPPDSRELWQEAALSPVPHSAVAQGACTVTGDEASVAVRSESAGLWVVDGYRILGADGFLAVEAFFVRGRFPGFTWSTSLPVFFLPRGWEYRFPLTQALERNPGLRKDWEDARELLGGAGGELQVYGSFYEGRSLQEAVADDEADGSFELRFQISLGTNQPPEDS